MLRKIPHGYSRHANIDHASPSRKRYAKAKRGACLPIAGYSQRCFARRSLSRRPRSVETLRGLRVLSDRAIKRAARVSVVFRSPWALERTKKPVSRHEANEMARAYPNSSDTDKSTACVQTGKQNEIHREAEKCTRFSLASYKMGIDASEQTSLFASLQSCRKSAFIVSWIHFVTRK